MRYRMLAIVLLAAASQAACEQSSSRDARLRTMAADEANLIDNHRERLARQLNVADWQLRIGDTAAAQHTLARAMDTLRTDAKDIDDFGRVSGYASIAELSRPAHAPDTAEQACDGAIEALQAIQPPSQRCELVMSLSMQIEATRGRAAAAVLLENAGAWAESLSDDAHERKRALVAFASRLFDFGLWDEGRRMLDHDPDQAWRTDTLAAISDTSPRNPTAETYGPKVDFKSVYRSQELQRHLGQVTHQGF